MPNRQVQHFESELAHLKDQREKLHEFIANHHTPFARNDIVSEIRYVAGRKNELRSNSEQLRQIYNASRNHAERENIQRRRQQIREALQTLEVRHSHAKRRLEQHDEDRRKKRRELNALGVRINHARDSLRAARQRG